MIWHAMPPELNTARLMVGAGSAPMLQAAAGWSALSAELQAQATELGTSLAALAGSWRGVAADEAISSAAPMVTWLQSAALVAQRRADQATAQAAAHTAALAATPSLPEIAANHVTRAVLVATNFLGINTMPIGLKETDYFVRMWNQAAGTMDAYQAATVMNTTFDPLPPRPQILTPGLGEAVAVATAGRVAELAAHSAVGDRLAALGARISAHALSAADAEVPIPKGANLLTLLTQASQLGTPLLQQLTQLLSQVGGSSLGGGPSDGSTPLGLTGAHALSNHPLAGGSGAAKGAGLARSPELPGIGGSPLRTALLANLIDSPTGMSGAAGQAAAGAGGAATGAVGGSGYGAAPVGMGPHGAGVKSAAPVATALTHQPDDRESGYDGDEPDDDDW